MRVAQGLGVSLVLVALVLPAGADWLAFTSTAHVDPEVYLIEVESGRLLRLTESTGVDQQPSWSGDGTRIAFVSDRDGARDIWRMSADGSKQVRLTDVASVPQAVAFHHPAWSPSGHRIAFESTGSQSSPPSLWLVGPDGTQFQSLAFLSRHAALRQPFWGLYDELAAVHISGEREEPLRGAILWYGFSDVIGIGSIALPARNVSLTVDGRRTVFDADGDIWVGDAEAGQAVNVTETPGRSEANPSWSHDGERIAFEVHDDSGPWISTARADGSDARRLVAGYDAAWAPVATPTLVEAVSWGRLKGRLAR